MSWRSCCKLFSFRQIQKVPLKLSMNMLVKNEVDIIADNIKFHSKMGVDSFIVMDNGSTDGTREILDDLRHRYELIIIDRPDAKYKQSQWKTEMAFKSRSMMGADWSIANDADEFWLPESGDLKKELTHWGSVIYCPRFNMQLDENFHEKNYRYYNSCLQVKSPILNKNADLINDDKLSIMLSKITGKVIVNNHGLLRVKGGNHRAWHTRNAWAYTESSNISVFHYPVRNKNHFLENIKNRSGLLHSNKNRMGDHYRRWVRLYNEGKIEEEITRFVLTQKEIRVLKEIGVIVENNRPREKIIQALDNA